MKVILDTNNPGDMQLVQLIATVIAAEGRKEAEYSDIPDEPIGMVPTESETDEDEPIGMVPTEPEATEEETEELDSEGQPWDAELHASTKAKTASGAWKKRRGAAKLEPAKVTESEFIATLTEHRGKFGIDRTKGITAEVIGVSVEELKIGELDNTQWPGVVAALKDDKGPKNNISLEDF